MDRISDNTNSANTSFINTQQLLQLLSELPMLAQNAGSTSESFLPRLDLFQFGQIQNAMNIAGGDQLGVNAATTASEAAASGRGSAVQEQSAINQAGGNQTDVNATTIGAQTSSASSPADCCPSGTDSCPPEKSAAVTAIENTVLQDLQRGTFGVAYRALLNDGLSKADNQTVMNDLSNTPNALKDLSYAFVNAAFPNIQQGDHVTPANLESIQGAVANDPIKSTLAAFAGGAFGDMYHMGSAKQAEVGNAYLAVQHRQQRLWTQNPQGTNLA